MGHELCSERGARFNHQAGKSMTKAALTHPPLAPSTTAAVCACGRKTRDPLASWQLPHIQFHFNLTCWTLAPWFYFSLACSPWQPPLRAAFVLCVNQFYELHLTFQNVLILLCLTDTLPRRCINTKHRGRYTSITKVRGILPCLCKASQTTNAPTFYLTNFFCCVFPKNYLKELNKVKGFCSLQSKQGSDPSKLFNELKTCYAYL